MQDTKYFIVVLLSFLALVSLALWFSMEMTTRSLPPSIALLALFGLGVIGYSLHYLNRQLGDSQLIEDRNRVIVERAKDGIVVAGEDGTIESVNPAAEKIFSYTESQLAGLSIATLMSAEYQDKEDESLSDFLQRNAIVSSGNTQEIIGVRNNDDPFPMDLAISRADFDDGSKFVVLLRDITERIHTQEALQDARDRLEDRVQERTLELEQSNHQLAREIAERKESDQQRKDLISKLNRALEEIKILGGLLPICSSCKKIRDDEGLWSQIEVYIDQHSEASFSHGICPDCMHDLYPELQSD